MAKKEKQQVDEDEDVGSAAQAFKKVGLESGEDVRKVFGKAAEANQQLAELHKKAEGFEPGAMRDLDRTLGDRAETDALLIIGLHKTLRIIERMPNWRYSDYAEHHEKARGLLRSIGRGNPYAREKADELERKEFSELVKTMREEADKDLTLTKVATSGTGKVHCFLPPRQETIKAGPRQGETRWIGRSHLLVEIVEDEEYGRVVKPVRALGRMEQFFGELSEKKVTIPASSLESGRLDLKRRLPQQEFQDHLGLLRILLSAKTHEAKSNSPADEEAPEVESNSTEVESNSTEEAGE